MAIKKIPVVCHDDYIFELLEKNKQIKQTNHFNINEIFDIILKEFHHLQAISDNELILKEEMTAKEVENLTASKKIV